MWNALPMAAQGLEVALILTLAHYWAHTNLICCPHVPFSELSQSKTIRKMTDFFPIIQALGYCDDDITYISSGWGKKESRRQKAMSSMQNRVTDMEIQ